MCGGGRLECSPDAPRQAGLTVSDRRRTYGEGRRGGARRALSVTALIPRRASLRPLEESTMDNEIQLISDGVGLAVIGSPTAVELFLTLEGLASKDLGLPRLAAVFKAGAQIAQAAPEIADTVGRWVELTKESAHLVEKHGLRKSSTSGLSTGGVKHGKGKARIGGLVDFAKDPVSQLSNPAVLTGAAGLMAQLAMQQTM